MSKTIAGSDLERLGLSVFKKMELYCISNLPQVRLLDLSPNGPHTEGEHLQIDYIIPYDEICLIGEITSRQPNKARDKYSKFLQQYDILHKEFDRRSTASAKSQFWTCLGVTDPKDLRVLRKVTSLKAFMICSEFERLEGNLEPVDQCPIFFRYEWFILQEYAECLGRYALHSFLDVFGVKPVRSTAAIRRLEYSAAKGNLLCARDRYVTSDRHQTSHVLTFLACPYELIPFAKVYRRDTLPSLDDEISTRYQRMLVPSKLESIRKTLITHADFMFPNSILVVLSKDCYFDRTSNTLTIYDHYGSVNVVDGQHRLFAYAYAPIQDTLGNDCRILVTAISFEDVSEQYVNRFSAKTFIEINTNQTKISSSHLLGIAYEMLGSEQPRDLAAHILRMVNERKNKLRGLLLTSDSPSGRIKSIEIITALARIINIDQVSSLQNPVSQKARDKRLGYERVFGCSIDQLQNSEILVKNGIHCVERYFNIVQKFFSHDWPSISDNSNGSAFELTKMFAALVSLLKQFIEEGLKWDQIENEIRNIQNNLMTVMRVDVYSSPLLRMDNPKAPNPRARISDNFKFLNRNRSTPTPMTEILKHK